MRDLEEKEKDLNKLNQKVENLLKYNHPAADKIEVLEALPDLLFSLSEV